MALIRELEQKDFSKLDTDVQKMLKEQLEQTREDLRAHLDLFTNTVNILVSPGFANIPQE